VSPRPTRILRAAFACAAFLWAAAGFARVGDKIDDLRKRFGRPHTQPNKETVVWIIEERAGPLLYTVTLGEKGVSIAEGLKPMKPAGVMQDEIAEAFVQEQLGTLPDEKSARAVKAGESYTFGGQEFVCAKDEVVALDPERLLVVWNRGPAKSVMAVTKTFLERRK
jgi:hypothetical protein